MIEVELKFELTAAARLRLEQQLTTVGTARHRDNSDTYYDTSSFDLFRQAVFVRVRNGQQLEFKFNAQAAPTHIHCTERVFSLLPEARQAQEMNTLFCGFLSDWHAAGTVKQALHQNSLIELAHIENRRIEYTYKNLLLCLDQVEGLGCFLEIEAQCDDESEIEQALSHIQEFTAGMIERQVHIGYVELWLQKYQPHVYRLGRYQEERVLGLG